MSASQEERIGSYRVHPVASLFPLLEGKEYEELKESIQTNGQTHPISVQGDMLLEGRNRLRVCLELGIEPRIQEYEGPLAPDVFIELSNLHRRHLNDEMRGVISAQIHSWRITEEGEIAKKSGKSADGAAGGRGHKKESDKPYDHLIVRFAAEPKTRARDARSTVGRIAEAAKVSHRTAARAVAVVRHASELAEKVAKGEMKLRDAAKQAHHRKRSSDMERSVAKAEPEHLPEAARIDTKTDRVAETTRLLMELTELPQPVSRSEIIKRLGEDAGTDHSINKRFELFIQCAQHIPWIKIERFREGKAEPTFRFAIDAELKEICERRRPLPAIDYADFFHKLRNAITEKRIAIGIARERRKWNPDAVSKLELEKLINFIEAELDKVLPKGSTGLLDL